MRFMRKLITLTVMVVGFAAICIPKSAAEADWNQFDTVAGFPIEVTIDSSFISKISKYEGKKLTLLGECPGGTIEERSYVEDGIASFTVTEEWTRKSGPCNFTLVDNEGKQIEHGSAEIFPDVVATRSLELVDSGDEFVVDREVELKAGFFDQYGNIAASQIVLLSSDADIEQGAEDIEGYMHFFVVPERGGEISLSLVDTLTGDSKRFRFQVTDPNANVKNGGNGGSRSNTVTQLLGELIRASLLDEYQGADDGGDSGSGLDYGLVDSFEAIVGDDESTLRLNEQYDLEIVALDRRGRRVENFVDRVIVETTDVDAVIPTGSVRFKATERGSKILPLSVMFQTPGEQEITIRDAADPEEVFGKTKVWVLGQHGAATSRDIVIEEYPGVSAGSTITISGTAPAYTNLHLFESDPEGGEKFIARTSSGEAGEFSFEVKLDSYVDLHTLLIRDPEGRANESESILISVDSSAPVLSNVTVTPSSVSPGGSFTVSMEAESGESVWVKIGSSDEVELTEGDRGTDGMSIYDGTFTAPDKPGIVKVTVKVRDRAGNEVTEETSLTVITSAIGIPKVMGLSAQVQSQDVMLSWNGVTEASRYRIYFGPDPTNLTRTVETSGATTNVKLTGLKAGQSYAFAVTAVTQMNEESAEKSMVVTARTQGSIFSFAATGRVNGAHLAWNPLADSSIQAYRIKYGVQSGVYSEERIVSASSTEYPLSDLINGVTYVVLLEAIKKNGDIITDTVEVEVTAGQNGMPGMKLSQHEPLPFSVGGGTHGVAPKLPRGGGGMVPLVGVICLIVCWGFSRKIFSLQFMNI